MCKASCGTHHKPTRLYFQSSAADGGPNQHLSAFGPGLSFDAEKLAEEVARLEKRNSALTEMVDAMKTHTKKLTEEVWCFSG
jgi:TRAF-interacting protein